MYTVFSLLLLLGVSQYTVGQYGDLSFNFGDFEEISGDAESFLENREELINDLTGRCGENKFGAGCGYWLYGSDAAVPKSEWKDIIPGGKKMCSIFGNSVIRTFDGASAFHSSTCEVLVAKLGDDDTSPKVWLTRSAECNNCISEVRMVFEDHKIIMRTFPSTEIVVDDKVTKDLPVEVDEIKMYEKMLWHYIESRDITIKIKAGESASIQLITSDKLSSRTDGLCGNMNGDKADDIDEKDRPKQIYHSNKNCNKPSLSFDVNEICLQLESTHEICNILLTQAFASCMTIVNPEPFLKLCHIDVCKGDASKTQGLHCNIATEYTDECSTRGGLVREWRSVANCAKTCPEGFQWSECADSTRTCAGMGSDKPIGCCSEGCECIDGTYLQDGKCVPREECKCSTGGTLSEPGATVEKYCGNKCTCQAGLWNCTDISCNGVATSDGLFHFTTFDGRSFKYRDSCSVMFAKDCGNKDFFVVVSYDERDDTVYKNVLVAVRAGEDWQKYTLRRDGKVDHDGKLKNTPINTGVVQISRDFDKMYLTILGKDVHVMYDMVYSVVVNVPASYKGSMCGLAGDYNGKVDDDFKTRSKYIVKDVKTFVDDWKLFQTCSEPVPEYEVTECSQKARRICQKILEYSATCGDTIEFTAACERDVCKLSGETLQTELACSSARGFTLACMEKSNEAFYISLQDTECQQDCGDELVYSDESSECERSCSVFNNACPYQIQAGCYCPEGTYQNDEGVCVEEEECPCLHEGIWYEVGAVTSIPNMHCSCVAGVMSCTQKNQTEWCPSPDMQYHSCDDPFDINGAACEKTCRDIDMICMAGACMTGCACKPGLYRTPDNECVPKESCGCFAGETYYNHGDSFKDDCNTVTCLGGTFVRTNLVCPKTCSAVGASHYTSFDGHQFNFEGDCEYILATDYCPNNPNGGLFSVHTKNTNCGSHGMTCSKYLIVTVKSQKMTLERGSEPVIDTIPHARFRRAVTGFTDHDAAEIFTIKQKGIFTVIDTCIGLTVLWDNGTRIYIRLTEDFQGTTCGMCGNYDGIDANDLFMSTGMQGSNIVEFGNSWKFPPQTLTCPDSTAAHQINASCTDNIRREWAISKCKVITDTNGVFASCHEKLSPQNYFDICVHDACGCDGGGDCECLCTAIAHYAHDCAQNEAVVEWRSNELCPIMCEEYNDNEDMCLWHYRSCATCITDSCCECQQPEDTHWCVEGCFPKCPEGYILDEMTQKCIKRSERDAKCTWYSNENMCHTCEKCNVCKTKLGATLRIEPGQTIFFPIATDACEREWCAMDTTGDLCYNGTIDWYDCNEEYKPIPEYDPRYYTQTCWNSTTSLCSNCRDCKQECILRNDSCDAGKTPDSGDWKKVFPVLPTPKIGAKTYCMKYSCENIPDATEPQCFRQLKNRVICQHNIDDVVCAEHEVLKIHPTGDDCCPETYECVCDVCAFDNNGKIDYMKDIQPGETNDWCMKEDTSNCCYTDTCTVDKNRSDKTVCPVMTRTQSPCTTGPAPTCSPGYVWKNLTRSEDCCPWGECECDACYDFDSRNNKVLKLIGDVWNKKCMKFRCVRGVRDITGCYKTKNFENITCAKKPECKNDEYVKIVGIDEWECCDIYDCVCYDQCHVTIGGTERVIDPGQEVQMDDGCWYKCVDSRTSEDDKNCPGLEKTCHEPKECEGCEFISDTVNNTCGCPEYDCQPVERCPSIDCPFPYVRFVDSTADKCKEPCYDCKCEECWDNYQNRTYQIGKTWRRQYVESAKCEDCSCANAPDEDGCLKETCNPTPCPEPEKCESPYDTPLHSQNECGCTILLGCQCPYCVFDKKIVEGKNPGDTWTIGDLERGCYDTYQCLPYKNPGMEKECYNVTKERKPCVVDEECPKDHVAIKSDEKSCSYDDGKHCPRYDCDCVKCRFNDKSYEPGQTWDQDCVDYECLNVTDESDPAKCKKITSKVVDCPSAKLDCKDCYIEYLKVQRSVPTACCDIWDCKPELFCINEKGDRVDNGTVWNTHECRRVQCIVSKEDWALGTCPSIVEIDHCDPDPTICSECQNTTIIKDKCECDKVTCPPNNPPKSCKDPSANMILDYFNTGDSCYSTKNCCVCDDACYYKGVRKDLFSVWEDKSTCQRLRCVLPETTVTTLGFNYDDIYFDDLYGEETQLNIRQMLSKLNYRKLMSDTNIPKSLYDACSQDQALCPVTLEIGCEKPKECGECEHTEEAVDACGCPILKCTPYVCPPSPYDVDICTEPKAVLKNISLAGLTELYPCCSVGRVCECRTGCLDKEGVLREVGETWDEVGTNDCGRTLTKKRCQAAAEFDDPKPECPKAVVVPCNEPLECDNCKNRTSYIDEYCCEIAKCEPLNVPVQCVEPGLNQRISNLETQDDCFPSKECCVCDTTCSYKDMEYNLFQVWEDAESCSRLRCVLPEETIRALGYTGVIDFKDLTNNEMTAKFSELKGSIDFRRMMLDTKVSEELYKQCQQNISLCPKTFDMGCKPTIECDECYTTTITQDSCGCDVATCELIERCPYITCPFPKKSREIADADPCKAPCYECSCDHICFDNFDNSTHEPGMTWKRTYREPVRKCESCVCTNNEDEKDGCLEETCEPTPCPVVEECPPTYNNPIYGKDDCGCQILIQCECTQCMYEGDVLKNRSRGDTWTVGNVKLGCFDTYTCEPAKANGKQLECYNVTKTRSECIVDDECPEDHVAVKNEEKSCCIEDKCCPRFDCKCIKCRFDGVSYNPGDSWTKDCIDYTCTNVTDETDPARCKRITSNQSPCDNEKPPCKDCYVEYLATKRDVSNGECCNIWGCQPEKVCVQEDGSRVSNGTIREPEECSRVQCTVSEEDWTAGICPTDVTIDHCDPDPTICNDCQNTTVVKDKCGCDKVTCPPNDPPKSCKVSPENMIIESFSTENGCSPTKDCCVCDDACYYSGERKDLFSVWWNKSTCQRLRCVLPDSTLTALGYTPADIIYDDLDNVEQWREILNKLSYRRIMKDTKIPTSLYSDCSQDPSFCPITYDMGCEKPKECGECEHTEEAVDQCSCPIFKCTPYVCPPEPYNVETCSEPKVVMKNISLSGLSSFYPCCKQGRICECREGCEDKEGVLHEIGEEWVETEPNHCGRSLIKKKCQAVADFSDPKPECPKEVIVPCAEPITCDNCLNRTSYIDEFCCEIAKCEPLNEPVQCVEPKENQRISKLETGDGCFTSKDCCVCDTTCSYKENNYQLFQVWEDAESCSRLRCVLPEETIRALGHTGEIDFKDLTNTDMLTKFNELKSVLDFRKMMLDTKTPEKLYEQCQQDIALCPKTIDIGCKPVIECDECHTTTITQDSCGCNVSTCDLIERCPYITCEHPKKSREIADSDPCKAPCYECSCDHICYDNFDNTTRLPGAKWKRTYRAPERKCESCVCTNDIDEKDDCLKETCEPIPCPKVAECEAPYDKAIYGTDDCGCKILIECECTQCMNEGSIVQNRSRGDSWTVGNVALGCYDTYYCDSNKESDKKLECYEVTKTRSDCIVDEECPDDHVAVQNTEKSCCIEDKCCPRFDCKCVVCRFDGVSYKPGDSWTKNCIDYTCTDFPDESDPNKCKLITSEQVPCNDAKPVCTECNVEYLAVMRDVTKDQCCNIWDCEPENVCVKEDGERIANGTIWIPEKCKRVQCMVSEVDFNNGICPTPVDIDHCINNLTVPCPVCTNKTIVKDECDCDSVSCPPNREPVQCTTPSGKQVLTTLETKNDCHPSKSCCMCDASCYYRDTKKSLFSVWIDEDTCKRMRCLPSETLLEKLGYDMASIDFKNIENKELWDEIRSKIDYRQMMIDSNIASKLYDTCSQDISLCPSAKSIGCPEPKVCPNCTNTIPTEDSCGCTVHTCDPFKCPPTPYDVTECTFPKTNLVEISLKGLTDKYPCCSVGRECICHPVCFDNENKSREIGEEWDETTDYQCSSDPTVSGSIVRKRCNPGISSSTKNEEKCPHTSVVPCEQPEICKACEDTILSLNEKCCSVSTCKKIECEINSAEDCVAPKTAVKSDATVTDNVCCPKYCDCPEQCLEVETGSKYDRNLEWPHPTSDCWTRKCLVDSTRTKNSGCPYIVNNTVCTEPKDCEVCFTAKDSLDACGCTTRKCERNACPSITCEDECDEISDTGEVDSCGCPKLICKPKPCPTKLITCEDPEKNVYSWMDLTVDKCCKQQGCRCNYTKCVEPNCPAGLIAVRNVSAVKCCCPEYICIPNDDSQCTDYNGMPRKIGEPWINKDNKCKMLQCSYENKKSRITTRIEEFDRFICTTEKPSCVNGGMPYLASTKEGCCSEWVCPCTCQVYGDPHFTTFDGFSYDYQGKCTYTLMKEYAYNRTEVIVDNELCRWQSARRKSLSCLKTMTVMHKGVNHTFTFGHKFELNGEQINVRKPWTSADGDVTVREYGYKQLKLQIGSLGLEIIYKTRAWMQSLILTIPYESLEGRMLGLCGSCNNDPSDEFRDKAYKVISVANEKDQLSIDKFGEGWIKNIADYDQPKCFPKEPVCPEESVFPDCGDLPADECIDCENKCHLSHPKCSSCDVDPCQVLRTHDIFKEARANVDPRTYMAKCAYDLSQENNVTNKCDACFSPSIAQYASLNEMHGICIPWRSALGCEETTCPDDSQVFRECDLDAKRDLSCDMPVLNITASVNVEGCFCPEGKIRRTAFSEECVPLKCCHGCSEPPTCEDGSVATTGERTDDCGCPVYMCSDVAGCEVQEKQQDMKINIDGKQCSTTEKIVSADCTGNCAVSTRSINGEFDTECSMCAATSKTTRKITLVCEDGSSEKYEYEVITACECSAFSCSDEDTMNISGDL